MQVSQSIIALSCGKIYHTKLRLPLEIDAPASEAIFLTAARQMQVRIYFVQPKQAGDDPDDVFERQEEKPSAGEDLLANNYKKVQEHQIEIKSDLLNDIF